MESDERRSGGMPTWVKVLIGAAVVLPLTCLGGFFVLALVVPQALVERLVDEQHALVRAELRALRFELDRVALENGGRYPDRLDELDVSPELRSDPWNRDYGYEPPGDGRSAPLLRTLGADGLVGGEGEDADLESDGLDEPR